MFTSGPAQSAGSSRDMFITVLHSWNNIDSSVQSNNIL